MVQRTAGQPEIGAREAELDRCAQGSSRPGWHGVIMTPLGRPVVPDVYINRWTSSAAAVTRAASSPAPARRSARVVHPLLDRLTC